MKIKDLSFWEEDYYPKKEKIRRKKPRKGDLDSTDKGYTLDRNKKKNYGLRKTSTNSYGKTRSIFS